MLTKPNLSILIVKVSQMLFFFNKILIQVFNYQI